MKNLAKAMLVAVASISTVSMLVCMVNRPLRSAPIQQETPIAIEEVLEASTEMQITSFLEEKGLSDFAIAGILANMEVESDGLVPERVQRGFGFTDEEYCQLASMEPDGFATDRIGFGLCQWTYSERKYLLIAKSEELGLPVESLEVQLNVLWDELNGEFKYVLRDLQRAESPEEAAVSFMLDFENPKDQSQQARAYRASIARTFYERRCEQ